MARRGPFFVIVTMPVLTHSFWKWACTPAARGLAAVSCIRACSYSIRCCIRFFTSRMTCLVPARLGSRRGVAWNAWCTWHLALWICSSTMECKRRHGVSRSVHLPLASPVRPLGQPRSPIIVSNGSLMSSCSPVACRHAAATFTHTLRAAGHS